MSYSTKIFVCKKNFSSCVTCSLRNLLGIYKLPNSFVASYIGRIRGLCDSLLLQSNDQIPLQSTNTTKSPTVRKIKPPKTPKHSSEMNSHLHQCNNKLDVKSIPRKLIAKTYSRADGLYVVGEKTANAIAERVVGDDINIPVFEVNPGLGVVTKALLEKNVQQIHAFQSAFWRETCELLEENSDRLFLHNHDFFTLWKRLLLDYSCDDEDIQGVTSIVKPKPWNDGPPMKIFASIPDKIFISHMIASLVFQNGYSQLGRLEFYLAMRPHDYHCVTADGSANYVIYRASSALFQIMFKKKLLCMLPAKDFIPWMKKLSLRKAKFIPQLTEADADCMYLVKATPRKDLHDIIQGAENMKALWHFVRQCFSLRSNRVIPTLEKWIPGCGPRLIFNNLTIFTEFGQLSPSEMLKLFQIFSKWPEYPDCTFLDSMETYFLKSYVDSNPDGISEAEFEPVDEGLEVDPDFDVISDPDETMDKV